MARCYFTSKQKTLSFAEVKLNPCKEMSFHRNMERVVHRGQRRLIRNGCDTMTQLLPV